MALATTSEMWSTGRSTGAITTMAVLAGSQGAALSARVGLLLGLAKSDFGDGISMGASNYLGMRSEIEQTGGSVAAEAPWRHGLATVARQYSTVWTS